MGVSPAAISRTLALLVVFFTLLGGLELLAPRRACVEGLAGPLTRAGVSIADMCDSIAANPAANLILFGLGKYHALFALLSAVALSAAASEAQRKATLVLHAINFACDVSWAAVHISWIGAGPAALVPQILLVGWCLWCAFAA